jgi:hypothetical protein
MAIAAASSSAHRDQLLDYFLDAGYLAGGETEVKLAEIPNHSSQDRKLNN